MSGVPAFETMTLHTHTHIKPFAPSRVFGDNCAFAPMASRLRSIHGGHVARGFPGHYNPPVFVGREPAYNTFSVGGLAT